MLCHTSVGEDRYVVLGVEHAAEMRNSTRGSQVVNILCKSDLLMKLLESLKCIARKVNRHGRRVESSVDMNLAHLLRHLLHPCTS